MTQPTIKFQFSVLHVVDHVGAIIDRPAQKCYVFALDFGEFVTAYRTGAH